MNLWMILFFIALGAFVYYLFSFQGFANQNDALKERLKTISDDKPQEARIEKKTLDAGKSGKARLSDILQNVGKIVTPGKIGQNIQKRLEFANIPLKSNEFVAIILLSTVLPMSLAMMLFKSFVIGLGSAVVGFIAPNFILSRKIAKRRRQFQDQMLDNLVMLSNSLKAGYSFLQGLDLLSKEAAPPSCEEYTRIVRESGLGMDLEKSMRDLNERMASEDFDLVVTVIMIQRQIGGNLSEILDGISNTIRERMRIKGQISTLTAQVRLSGIIVAGMPIAIFLGFYAIRPDLMSLFFTYHEGWFHAYYMLLVCGVMEGIGFMIMQKIGDIEV
ncbi:MAG: type II secretion system F family protein [Candidatus Wallbacteria bacterium]|nr:type II secretion system F family protein [Candidatus Wallbacteria bacterium]